jgi:hypothetical protein
LLTLAIGLHSTCSTSCAGIIFLNYQIKWTHVKCLGQSQLWGFASLYVDTCLSPMTTLLLIIFTSSQYSCFIFPSCRHMVGLKVIPSSSFFPWERMLIRVVICGILVKLKEKLDVYCQWRLFTCILLFVVYLIVYMI